MASLRFFSLRRRSRGTRRSSPPHRLDDAGWTDARSSMRCTVLGAPHTYRTWVTDFDGENLRDGFGAEAGVSGMQTFKKAPAVALPRSLTKCA